MNQTQCDSIIFDLDGTLWDASSASAKAWTDTAKKFGIDVIFDETAIKSVSGLPFDKCVDALMGAYVQKIKNLREHLDESEKKEILSMGGRIYPGVNEGLRRLAQRYKLFLVSNCQKWYLESFFQHSGLGSFFQDSICFGQTFLPKSENIKIIVNNNHLINPIYVGDTHWDQAASKSAGVKFIFAKYGFGSIPVQSQSISSFEGLLTLLGL